MLARCTEPVAMGATESSPELSETALQRSGALDTEVGNNTNHSNNTTATSSYPLSLPLLTASSVPPFSFLSVVRRSFSTARMTCPISPGCSLPTPKEFRLACCQPLNQHSTCSENINNSHANCATPTPPCQQPSSFLSQLTAHMATSNVSNSSICSAPSLHCPHRPTRTPTYSMHGLHWWRECRWRT